MHSFHDRSPRFASSILAASACCALALSFAACSDIPKRKGASVDTVSPVRLDVTLPTEVVVAPILNPSANAKLPADALRESFQHALVRRRYSPLAIDYVDTQVVDAAYRPGSLQEEAVLEVTVERWDASLWEMRGSLTVKLNVRLVDARKSGGSDLWSGRMDRRFDFAIAEGAGDARVRLKHACDEIANEVLAALPARQSQPRTASR